MVTAKNKKAVRLLSRQMITAPYASCQLCPSSCILLPIYTHIPHLEQFICHDVFHIVAKISQFVDDFRQIDT